jgi:hypothetical protein
LKFYLEIVYAGQIDLICQATLEDVSHDSYLLIYNCYI